MSELSLERAAEMVLARPAWEKCAVCHGQGNITSKEGEMLGLLAGDRLPACAPCKGAGYLQPPEMKEAYELTNTPYPEKPLSGPDYYAQTMKRVQDGIKASMNKYIGVAYTDATQLEKAISQTLEAEVPGLKDFADVKIDPNDPTRILVNIGDKK